MSSFPCSGCFLYESRGVCAVARDIYGIEDPADVERLRAAVHAEIVEAVSLVDLVRQEVGRGPAPRLLSSAPLAALPPVASQSISTDSKKEACYGHVARPVQ